ncbi:MAG TPA: ABC transporter permease [Planctomicrobium sp.]|nr:ABC transporter permease [Planctomicrobium sp.]
MLWFRRILALIRKEFQILLNDPRSRELIVLPVILQTCLFPLAATLEVKNNTLAILNEDNGNASYELVQRFSASSAFTHMLHLREEQEIARTLDSQQAIAVIRFPEDFSRKVAAGETASLQILLDGRRSNSSQIAASYLQTIAMGYFNERAVARGVPPTSELIVWNRYNPNLNYTWFILPTLVAVILTIGSLVTTALSVAREREMGTFDQLLVSPLTPEMIMIGKAVPSMLIGLGQATAILLGAIFLYGVPFNGSFLLLYGSALFYFLSLVGFGMMISSVCSTQQQAFLGAFAFVMPSTLLSGFAAPIENMPMWLQYATWLNPIRHYIVIVKSIILKDVPIGFVLQHSLPLLIISVVTLSVAVIMFRRQ